MKAILVAHTHWDREWYRGFQAFRARLVDAVDRLLDLCADDPAYRFLLDGQSIALEDYAAIRPNRVEELRACIARGQIAIGPWYVQPDSLLPSGEAHVRNLAEGRRAGEAFGPVSRVAYTPDSFGHPAQFPQLLAGFGMLAFVYWRGHGDEVDALPGEFTWLAPDGSNVLACHLARGYFNAASSPDDSIGEIAAAVAVRAKDLALRARADVILLMNGIDHAPPDPRAAELAAAIADAIGMPVQRGLLEDFVSAVQRAGGERPQWRGELLGARAAPLLPGVWSTRSWIKLANRRCEAELEGWAEPFAALAQRAGGRDERASLRTAWRTLLQNQAHDSLCGCSIDPVHRAMAPRFAEALELGQETGARALRALTGAAPRRTPWSDEWDVAVFNPSPHPRSDVVRIRFDPDPWMAPAANPAKMLHPVLLLDGRDVSFTANGAPARVVVPDADRVSFVAGRSGFDLEVVAQDVPAFGWSRVQVRRTSEPIADRVEDVAPGDPGARIAVEDRSVALRDDGSLDVSFGPQTWRGLLALEDLGDRGDSYDFDPVGENSLRVERVAACRIRHPSGIERLEITRTLRLPARLDEGRETRSAETVRMPFVTRVRLAPRVPRIDVELALDNGAEDHRLRVLFPLGAPLRECHAAGTFDLAHRRAGAAPDANWVQRAPATFPIHGFVHAAGLTVAAPGLQEAELVAGDEQASLALTLLRCVGHLSRHDLRTRPMPAGPGIPTPGAQCAGRFEARLALFAGLDPNAARDFELGLRAVPCSAGLSQACSPPALELSPRELVLSALKPADDGEGLILRVLNPTDRDHEARLEVGFSFERAAPCALDESPLDGAQASLECDGATLRFPVPAHALASVRLE